MSDEPARLFLSSGAASGPGGAELRGSDEWFAAVEDYAIFTLDRSGHIRDWNVGAERIKGYRAEEIVGSHFSCFYSEKDRSEELPERGLREAEEKGKFLNEGWRYRKDGGRFWASVTITALRSPDGALTGFLKITRDLTDRRKVEVLEETDRKKDRFLATLAHELRNPLAPILMGVEMIEKAPDDTDAVRHLAGMLRRQMDQMVHLIDDLLDTSRIATGKISLKRRIVPLAEVLESARETVVATAAKRSQDLRIEIPSVSVMIDADPHRLAQVVSNLLTNAVKFTPERGWIRLEARVTEDRQLEISVSDNGMGVPKSEQKRIFELFEQGTPGAEGGLGIGLTLVKSIVNMHGGEVYLHSEGADKGSEFLLRLPIVISGGMPEEGCQGEEKQEVARKRQPRVLVVDDGKNAADILTMFFAMEGIACETAYDGLDAVEKVRSFGPDLVCMDLGMPRMNGFEAAKAIRGLNGEVTLVALSGWGTEEDRRHTAEAGFDHHLVKPVSPADLRELIRRYLTS
ncbi:MAG: ATP-binding protein [Luteolibacter sp.]